ncbi:hypothetical protein M422DRAFT_34678 [Sphaerobolus stellatus SS14]|uniref:Uncharacterized protein n=1 Tax=Sphaerobolus stellatus (strain SS14) TaxID=990650 RepID=A0A0C9TXS1_SPHS4|nr:hypothetical protein M422DRAFT_34678 [Sphaerobolus stellatus SS14]
MGSWWLYNQGSEGNVECDSIELMERMLAKFKFSGQKVIWRIEEKVWFQTGEPWPGTNLGTVLGSGLGTYMTEEGRPESAERRLFMILMTESAYLIWKIRCEWRIQHEGRADKKITDHEVRNRWIKQMSTKIYMHILCTDQQRYRREATALHLVQKTWDTLLKTEKIHGLCPGDITGFLVGI